MELLNVDLLRVYLRAEEFLSDDDMERLSPYPPHYVGSQIVEELVKLVQKKGEVGLEKFLSALRKSANAGNEPGHEELLQLLECKDCSSTTQSAEVNVSQKEAGNNDPQSNEEVAQIVLEDCHDEPNVLDLKLEGPLDDPEGNITSRMYNIVGRA